MQGRTITYLASLSDMPLESAIAAATGNNARVYRWRTQVRRAQPKYSGADQESPRRGESSSSRFQPDQPLKSPS